MSEGERGRTGEQGGDGVGRAGPCGLRGGQWDFILRVMGAMEKSRAFLQMGWGRGRSEIQETRKELQQPPLGKWLHPSDSQFPHL